MNLSGLLLRSGPCLVALVMGALMGCRGDGSTSGGDFERITTAAAPLGAGAGTMGSCAGNPARCAAVSLSGGDFYTLALKGDGTAWAWGANSEGQLGDGTKIERWSPVQVSSLDGFTAVAAGEYHTAALKADKTAWTWGYNVDGQLGDGTTVSNPLPVKVPSLNDVVAVAVGGAHTAALTDDGTIWTWGRNIRGQLGDGTTSGKVSPIQVPSLTGVVAISAGLAHTVALRGDGTVWAWGWNAYGQLGDGTTADRSAPTQVLGLSEVVAIASKRSHTIALKADGTMAAWGYNAAGQLGDGTLANQLVPVAVSSLFDVVALATGESHSVALTKNGGVWTWGGNGNGQLGDGTKTSRSAPALVNGLSDVVAIAAGEFHTVALEKNGAVRTWGYNLYGQLGDGTKNLGLVPVAVGGGFNLAASCKRLPACDEVGGVCVVEAVLDGTACDDGDVNTTGDACTAGVCAGVDHCVGVVCPPADQCRDVSVCIDHATGECSNAAKPNGTGCDDDDACTEGDSCQGGTCVGASVLTCPAHSVCNKAFGDCECILGFAGPTCETCALGYSGYPNCEPEVGPGLTCASSADCGGGSFCVDGYCCDSECTGQCEACDAIGQEGTCSLIVGAPHGARVACAGGGTVCGGACDGTTAGACVYPTQSCRAASCAQGTATQAAVCDGQGHCPDLVTATCPSGACDGATCLGGCASDDDCAPNEECVASQCVLKSDGGIACGSDLECPKTAECQQPFCNEQGQCKSRSLPERTACGDGRECFAGSCVASPAAAKPGDGGAGLVTGIGGDSKGTGEGGGADLGAVASCAVSRSGATTSPRFGALALGALAAVFARRRRAQ